MSASVSPEQTATALRRLHASLLDCWNRRDAGSAVDGAAAIEAHLRQIFADHVPAAYVSIVREVRQLGAGAALLRAVAGMVPPGQTRVNPAVNAVQSLVGRRVGTRWRIELFQNAPAALHGRPDTVAALTAELQQQWEATRG